MREGTLKDWGSLVGGLKGHSGAEGAEVEIGSFIQRYVPYVSFKDTSCRCGKPGSSNHKESSQVGSVTRSTGELVL